MINYLVSVKSINGLKDLRNSLIVGQRIVFHRWHERMQTTIKNIDDNFCHCVLGYDANSLYLYCVGQKMPTGWYRLLEKQNNYKRLFKYSQQSIQWLEYISNSQNIHIQHAKNDDEYRINKLYYPKFFKIYFKYTYLFIHYFILIRPFNHCI